MGKNTKKDKKQRNEEAAKAIKEKQSQKKKEQRKIEIIQAIRKKEKQKREEEKQARRQQERQQRKEEQERKEAERELRRQERKKAKTQPKQRSINNEVKTKEQERKEFISSIGNLAWYKKRVAAEEAEQKRRKAYLKHVYNQYETRSEENKYYGKDWYGTYKRWNGKGGR